MLHSFGGPTGNPQVADGEQPDGAVLVQDAQGNLYGTTSAGGLLVSPAGGGTVFKLDPAGNETVLHTFTGAGADNGAYPFGPILDAEGNLYGTTAIGGNPGCGVPAGCGTVFKLTPNIITVNTLSDSSTSGDGLCSLREAITNTNNPGNDTTSGDCAVGNSTDLINFSVTGTINLSGALPAVQNTLTIDGSGQNITISGGGLYGVLQTVTGASLDLNALTIANGYVTASLFGVIYNPGTLAVTNSTFTGNLPEQAIIYNSGTVTISNDTFTKNANVNSSSIFNAAGSATVTNTTFSNNYSPIDNTATLNVTGSTFASNNNCGIVNFSSNGVATVTDSTFSNNTGAEFGGGIDNEGGTLTVTNSTFEGNSVTGDGGAIFNNGNPGTATITNSTIVGNQATAFGGGLMTANNGATTITNSVLAGNTAGLEPGEGNCTGFQFRPRYRRRLQYLR